MNRRSLLRSIAALPAVAAALPASPVQTDLTAARDKGLPAGPPLVPPGISETPNTPVTPADETARTVIRTFNADQMTALSKLGELMAPAWDGKPGAAEAGAAEFLDFLVGCSPESRISLYKSGLDTLNHLSREKFGKMFALTTSSEADTLLTPLREPWSYGSAGKADLHAFLLAAKEDLLRATVNSRPYIDAVSQVRRPRNASSFYWYPIN
ncbi:MAG: gluconate 2-dehydrogenase subunit 3 family protein [Acidobacteriota bacterium]|nr:gluconate 2-dehydrogenase subunit 3 family protein [Acidobacteriota bacterium]